MSTIELAEKLAAHVGEDGARFDALHERFNEMKRSIRTWGMLGGGIGGGIAMAVHMMGGCGGVPVGRPDPATVATFGAAQIACVQENPTRATIDACRAKARAAWCARWPLEIDCTPEGGLADGHE